MSNAISMPVLPQDIQDQIYNTASRIVADMDLAVYQEKDAIESIRVTLESMYRSAQGKITKLAAELVEEQIGIPSNERIKQSTLYVSLEAERDKQKSSITSLSREIADVKAERIALSNELDELRSATKERVVEDDINRKEFARLNDILRNHFGSQVTHSYHENAVHNRILVNMVDDYLANSQWSSPHSFMSNGMLY